MTESPNISKWNLHKRIYNPTVGDCSVLSYVVWLPISLFADNVHAFQRDFSEEVEHHRQESTNGPRSLMNWNSIIKHVPESKRLLLGSWAADLNELRKEQNLRERQPIRMPELEVFWPANIIPYFQTVADVCGRIKCSSQSVGANFVFVNGWVRHEIDGVVGPRYTPGPLFGEAKHWIDYQLGATVTVMVPRAIELVGEEALVYAQHWNWTTRDIFWQKGCFNADKYQPLNALPKMV